MQPWSLSATLSNAADRGAGTLATRAVTSLEAPPLHNANPPLGTSTVNQDSASGLPAQCPYIPPVPVLPSALEPPASPVPALSSPDDILRPGAALYSAVNMILFDRKEGGPNRFGKELSYDWLAEEVVKWLDVSERNRGG